MTNNSIYLAHRDSEGNELKADATVSLSFKIDPINTRNYTYLRCAYISSDTYYFSKFETNACETTISRKEGYLSIQCEC